MLEAATVAPRVVLLFGLSVWLAAACCWETVPPLQPGDVAGAAIAPVELSARLGTVAWGEVWRRDLELSPDAQVVLQRMIITASDKLSKDRAPAEKIERTEALLRGFVHQLEQRMANTRAVIVNADAINGHLSSICPLYPFC